MVLENNNTLEIQIHGLKVQGNSHWSEYVFRDKVKFISYGDNRHTEKETKKLFFNTNPIERIEQIKKIIEVSESIENKEFAFGNGVLDSVIADLKLLDIEDRSLVDDVQMRLHYEYLIYIDELENRKYEMRSFLNPNIVKRYSQIEKRYIENSESLFFCENKTVALKRFWQIEEYLQNIFNKFKETLKRDKYNAICYLIDEQYKIHRNIIEEQNCELLLRFEINYIIFEAIEIQLNEFYNTETIQAKSILQQKSIKFTPLKWNANKNTIGTLFGLLYDAGIIQGAKSDLSRGLANMFVNLSESTLVDNIALKTDKKNSKPKYDTKTEDLLCDWIAFLKSCTLNEG